MSKLALYLPRLALFGVMVVVGFVISSAVVQALQDRSPQSAATEAPDYVLAGAPDTPGGSPEPVVFNVEPSGSPETLESLAPADLTAAADSLLGAEPGGLQEPVGLPAHPADHPVRRRPVPGLELHADLGRDARAPRVRDRDLRLDAPHAAGRPGRRHRPQRPQPGPVARLRRHAADGVPAARPAQGPALEGLRRGHPGRVREDPARRSACRRTSSAATRSTSTATTPATPTRGSRRPTT